MKTSIYAMSVGVMLWTRLAVPATTWYVDASVPKAGDGTSWQKALKKIQSGIDKAAEGDTVIVAQGTYVENINFNGKNIVLRSTNPTDWKVVKETIIDGNKAGSVVTFYGTEDETCVLSGFTIWNGTGSSVPDPTFPGLYGGGILGVGADGGTTRTRATIQNNIITGNSAETGGGGGLGLCYGPIRNNIIIGNSCQWWGGGIGFCNGIIENNLIAGNVAPCGGGISFSNAIFRNNVVVGNIAGSHGPVAHIGTSSYNPPLGGSVSNCIVWGNTSPTGPQVYDSVTPTYSCIQDWTGAGEGNVALNPGFVDPDGPDDDPNTFEDNDCRLLANSPCIDAGINEDWMNGALDLDGNPRILAGISSLTVDMGAYEVRFSISGIRIVPATGRPELSWESRRMVWYGVWSCTDLAGGLWNAEAEVGSKGDVMIWTDPDTASVLKFYRVEIK